MVQRWLNRFAFFAFLMVSRICTLFYRRPLVYFTIQPIQTIIAFRNDPDSSKLERAVRKFREGKLKEQKIVNIAGTLSAAATIGVFSWPELATTHWYAKALWYSSLVLAIFSLIGLSQSRLTEAVSCIEEREASEEEKKAALRVFVDPDDTSMDDDGESPMSWYTRNMVFVWQWTLMVMVWSWVTFLMALLLHIIKPFLPTQNPKTADRNVAIFFLAVLTPIILTYTWCAWWTGYATKKPNSTFSEESVLRYLEKLLD
ncbi:hypothetical protein EG327_009307 [Venturia inaequalis]|uniref:Uncharacterized protein n=1 Tax=Venturia inaequalis TaxID=5025 RepID=A0A8H3VR85_VENIN|nr:hypothetical protein EG327_009307 [Venturia inaequalis]